MSEDCRSQGARKGRKGGKGVGRARKEIEQKHFVGNSSISRTLFHNWRIYGRGDKKGRELGGQFGCAEKRWKQVRRNFLVFLGFAKNGKTNEERVQEGGGKRGSVSFLVSVEKRSLKEGYRLRKQGGMGGRERRGKKNASVAAHTAVIESTTIASSGEFGASGREKEKRHNPGVG